MEVIMIDRGHIHKRDQDQFEPKKSAELWYEQL